MAPMKMAAPAIIFCAAGLFLRILLINSPFVEFFTESNEAATPLTSWKRVTEGLTLYRNGISPYSGDVFHETPLLLRFLNVYTCTRTSNPIDCSDPNFHESPLLLRFLNLLTSLSPDPALLFVALDLVIAVVLEKVGHHFVRYLLTLQTYNVKSYHHDSASMILTADKLQGIKLKLMAAYLFNPYTLATCLAKSTAAFNNLIIALIFLFTLKGRRSFACLCVALAAYQSVYPIMLLVPVVLHFTQLEARTFGYADSRTIRSMVKHVLITCFFLAWFLGISLFLEGSGHFLYSTYGFIFTVPDLTPNIGVFWYFFTEMFEHFRTFFLWVFQLHLFIYVLPLGIKLRSHTMFLMFTLLALTSVFKSYPSYGDMALYLSLLPMWSHTFKYTRNLFLVGCMFVGCTVMAPILYHLWIEAGSANANFYFAITLALSTAQVFLITDLLFAYLRREYHLVDGPKPTLADGTPAVVQLR